MKDKETKRELIDDKGIHSHTEPLKVNIFVYFCRIVTAALIGLGIAALIVGYM